MTVVAARGVDAPAMLYGTAWKEDATERLVLEALRAGFRGIDTANQRKHYYEAAVGRAIQAALAQGLVRRDEIFLQTKFTYRDSQDHRLPYDPRAPIAEQVVQSLESSLSHLGVDRLESLLLHGPSQRNGIGRADREAWLAMEALVDAGRVRLLGISNVSARQVKDLIVIATVPPAFVQNRCYADREWDAPVRAVCAREGITYQGFSLLTANRQVLADRGVGEIARRHGKTPEQVVFRFAQQLGVIPLTGTSDPRHMREDLDAADLDLSRAELAYLERAGVR